MFLMLDLCRRLMRSSMSSSFPPNIGPIRVDLIFRFFHLLSRRADSSSSQRAASGEEKIASVPQSRVVVASRRDAFVCVTVRYSTCRQESRSMALRLPVWEQPALPYLNERKTVNSRRKPAIEHKNTSPQKTFFSTKKRNKK